METATVENNWQENLSGTVGGVVFQKNNRIRIRKIQGKRKRTNK
jgi:hypothetical protein